MNKVVLIGRLTKDIDLKFAAGTGTAVARGILAVNRRFKKEGQAEADFIPIVLFKKNAENIATYTKKGSLVGISGSIQTRNYDKDGTKVYATEILVGEVQFLEPKNTNTQSTPNNQYNNNYSGQLGEYEDDITPIDDGDIPF